MTNEQTISWILLATALATQTAPAEIREISLIADGINHAVPTPKELQYSISWLIKNEFVAKNGNKYLLTGKGQSHYEAASKDSIYLLDIWKNLEQRITNYA